MFDPIATPLSLLETRVLGVLIEKEAATPDNYPLTLNSLVAGCNQKTSRDPIMNASESEVQMAVDALKRANLVIESYGSRVSRLEHNAMRGMGLLDKGALAVIGVLMLRGPQTPGEIRTNTDRIHRFGDLNAVERLLESLAEYATRPLVKRLGRLPGSREARYAHLLGGPIAAEAMTQSISGAASADVSTTEIVTLKTTVTQLRAEVDALHALVDRLYQELGLRK
ncbi:MAG: YceH family protein [Burkholderiales bacterium]